MSLEALKDSCPHCGNRLLFAGNEVFVQAGAGIVADSDPEREWWETVNKAKALMKAISMAESVQE